MHHAVKREEVQNAFEQFAQVLHASQRPLPTQTGDGAYLEDAVAPSLMQDLRSLGFQDVKTLLAVMQTKATGALADDKTYIMERVIQVCWRPIAKIIVKGSVKLTGNSLARERLARSLEEPG